MWIALVLFTVLCCFASPVHGGHEGNSAGVKSVEPEGLAASYQPFSRVTPNSSPDPTTFNDQILQFLPRRQQALEQHLMQQQIESSRQQRIWNLYKRQRCRSPGNCTLYD